MDIDWAFLGFLDNLVFRFNWTLMVFTFGHWFSIGSSDLGLCLDFLDFGLFYLVFLGIGLEYQTYIKKNLLTRA